MNTIKIGVIALVCWCASSTALAETVMFETLGKFAQIQLPKNMCDYTDTEYGAFIKSFLTERANASDIEMPDVKLYFPSATRQTKAIPGDGLVHIRRMQRVSHKAYSTDI